MPIIAVSVEGRTLQQFLSVTRDELASRIHRDAIAQAAESVDKAAARQLSRWPELSTQLADHLCGFLQQNAVGIFAGVWSTYAELRRYARETLEQEGSTTSVGLADHSFSWSIAPAIDIRWYQQTIATIPVSIDLACAVSALELTLKRGAIQSLHSGKCNCKANISCAGYPLWEKTILQTDLPGVLTLSEPIPLVH